MYYNYIFATASLPSSGRSVDFYERILDIFDSQWSVVHEPMAAVARLQTAGEGAGGATKRLPAGQKMFSFGQQTEPFPAIYRINCSILNH